MSPKGNESSTQRLLEIIRGGRGGRDAATSGERQPDAGSVATPDAADKGAAKAAKGSKGRNTGKARQCVGVDIGPFGLSLVKTDLDGNGKQTLLGYWQVPYDDPDISFDSPEFALFLRRKMAEFIGSAKKTDIWSLVSSAKAELWHMLVPRVPRNKLAETVYWAARKEKRFDEKELVLDFENQGEVMDKGVPKLRIMAYLVPRAGVEKRRKLFEAAGYKLAGITISPIALQTIFRSGWIPDAANVSANVFVGRNWSRMDVYSAGNLILSRTMKAGVFSMIETLQIEYNEQAAERFRALHEAAEEPAVEVPAEAPAPDEDQEIEFELDFESLEEIADVQADGDEDADQEPGDEATPPAAASDIVPADGDDFVIEEADPQADGDDFVIEEAAPQADAEPDGQAVPQAEEPSSLDFDQAKRLLYHKLLGRPLGRDDTGSELDAEEVFAMIRPAVERLVRQLERTFEHAANELGSESVEMVFFSGDICTNDMLIDFIRSQVGLSASLLDPMDPALPGVANIQVPDSKADRLTYNLTIGLALCTDESAPNLLNTFQQRDQTHRAQALNRNLAMGFLGLVLVLSGVLFWQQGILSGKKADLAALRTELETYSPHMDTTSLMVQAGKAKARLAALSHLSRRYEPLAVAREVAMLTPGDVRLLSLNLDLGTGPVNGNGPAGSGRKAAKAGLVEAPAKVLIIDGVVTGQRRAFDATLATYLVRLQDSPLFSTPVVHSREVESMSGLGETLHFVLHINLPS